MKTKKDANNHSPLYHENHKKPITRRDFLSQGFLSGLAMCSAPGLGSILGYSKNASAAVADCSTTTTFSGMIPFIGFDLAGGANIAGSNVIVGGPGGQQDLLSLEAYEKLGLPSDMAPQMPGQINTDLGLAFHADSAILRGILSKTSAATQANINGAVLAARSANDTGNNPHNPIYGINKAGASGDLVSLIGTRNSESGGRSQSPENLIDVSVRPTRIATPNDAMGLVDTGKLVNLLNQQDATKVMQTIERISAIKLGKISEDQAIKSLVQCGYIQSADLVSRYGDPAVLDPASDIELVGGANSIFTVDEFNNDELLKIASVAKLVVNGFAGAGTVEFGGFDYHNDERARGENKDFLAGQAIGASLEYAARLNKPLMTYVFSDGSVAANSSIDNSADGRGKLGWRGDNSSTSSVFFLVYNPLGRPQPIGLTSQQIGFFRPDGSVETSALPISNNVGLLAESIVLNYLALHNQTSNFSTVLPNNGLGNAALIDSLIAFQPLV